MFSQIINVVYTINRIGHIHVASDALMIPVPKWVGPSKLSPVKSIYSIDVCIRSISFYPVIHVCISSLFPSSPPLHLFFLFFFFVFSSFNSALFSPDIWSGLTDNYFLSHHFVCF